MLSYVDILAFAGMDEAEVEAIARHRRVPYLVAVGLAQSSSASRIDRRSVERMLQDDLAAARACGDTTEAVRLRLALRDLVEAHRGARAA